MDKISKEQILDFIAPCSLLCYSCPGFTRGIICELSSKLHNYFEGFYEFQVKYAPEEYKPRADLFREFKEFLLRFKNRYVMDAGTTQIPNLVYQVALFWNVRKNTGSITAVSANYSHVVK